MECLNGSQAMSIEDSLKTMNEMALEKWIGLIIPSTLDSGKKGYNMG